MATLVRTLEFNGVRDDAIASNTRVAKQNVPAYLNIPSNSVPYFLPREHTFKWDFLQFSANHPVHLAHLRDVSPSQFPSEIRKED
jgi:hypothetical protein